MGAKELIAPYTRDFCHPNRISALGVGLGLLGAGLSVFDSTKELGLMVLPLAYSCDGLDGFIAREFDRKTKAGADLDPLCDKLRDLPIGVHQSMLEVSRGNYFIPLAHLANVIVDGISANQRAVYQGKTLIQRLKDAYNSVRFPLMCEEDISSISSIRANWFGKAKTGIRAVCNLGYYLNEILLSQGFNSEDYESAKIGIGVGLVATAILGGIGVYKKFLTQKAINDSNN